MSYLRNLAYISNIVIKINYLVAGHSFMPTNRSFGRVKKEIKRKDPTMNVNEYIYINQGSQQNMEIFKRFSFQ